MVKSYANNMDVHIEESNTNFYKNAVDYWSDVPPTVNGMLGGYGHVSQADIQGSRNFLKQIFQSTYKPGKEKALDCGAGIGRITKNLLSIIFDEVDLVEQNPTFLEQAKTYLNERSHKIKNYFPIGLQDFYPEENTYDVIWAQWVLSHLTDEHLVNFLMRCKLALKQNGIIVIKENITSSDDVEIDEKDSSVTRSYAAFMNVFEKSGLNCFKKQKQLHFPKELFTVYMFALRPN